MSKKYPECPQYNHNNCKHAYSPEVCALSRKDKVCLKKGPDKKKVAGSIDSA
jgi:hypothetical protein